MMEITMLGQAGEVIGGAVLGACGTGLLWLGRRLVVKPAEDIMDTPAALAKHIADTRVHLDPQAGYETSEQARECRDKLETSITRLHERVDAVMASQASGTQQILSAIAGIKRE
jgi:hypothetical protein